MIGSLLAGISGLKAHQVMLDVTGNNLANVNTYAFKSARVHFSELLNQTIKAATAPTAATGGTNPVQSATGVSASRIERDMTQGSMVITGRSLDMAIEGEGYFTLHDGQKNVFTRVGAFGVDSQYMLVDPGTGYRVQRMGSAGIEDGFQQPYSNNIRVPYDVALPAKVTATISYTGNLSADHETPTTNYITSGMSYTRNGAVISGSAQLEALDQTSGLANGDTFAITGTDNDGTTVSRNYVLANVGDADPDLRPSMDDLLAEISTAFSGATAELVNGEIRLKDDAAGFSRTDLKIAYTPAAAGTVTLPAFFQYLEVGGQEVKPTNVEIFDSQGISHTLSGTFTKSSTVTNQWDYVLTGLTGAVKSLTDRRIRGIEFLADGSYGGLNSTIGDTAQLKFTFTNDPTNTRVLNMGLGSVGKFDGLSQFGGSSTAAPSGQDGYGPGWLSSLSITREGIVAGIFTNGVRRDIAELRITTFQNSAGLENAGQNYYVESPNSGTAIPTSAMAGGAGTIRGGSLEKSNVDVATQFVNLIQAQNGYQASARTIRVSNDLLRELAQLIR